MGEEIVEVNNLHNHLRYETFPETQTLIINWDCENIQMNELITNEYNMLYVSGSHYFNGLWVNEIKKLFHWDFDKTIDVNICHLEHIGKIVIFQYADNLNYDSYTLKIDENGYLFSRPIRIGTPLNEFVKCDCLYNDEIDRENNVYTLK